MNICSLGSETNMFSLLTGPGARSLPVKINLHKLKFNLKFLKFKRNLKFLQFIRNMCLLLSSGNLDRAQAQSNLQSATSCAEIPSSNLICGQPTFHDLGVAQEIPLHIFLLAECFPMPARERPSISLTRPLQCVQNVLSQSFVIHSFILQIITLELTVFSAQDQMLGGQMTGD